MRFLSTEAPFYTPGALRIRTGRKAMRTQPDLVFVTSRAPKRVRSCSPRRSDIIMSRKMNFINGKYLLSAPIPEKALRINKM
jgi:hypothetical protein